MKVTDEQKSREKFLIFKKKANCIHLEASYSFLSICITDQEVAVCVLE